MKNKSAILSAAMLFLLTPLFSFSIFGFEEVPLASRRMTPMVEAVQKVIPAVVNISTERMVAVTDPFESFYRNFIEESSPRYYRQSIPLGSGVIVASPGLVLTNLHVIRRATNIKVHFVDGEVLPARLVAFNHSNDLALLRVRQEGNESASELQLPTVDLALPEDLFLAETVIAVGNPFGLESSVSAGVLSARNRHWRQGNVEFHDILQTDAAINPGNSGGPLVNLDGMLIGLNLAIRTDAEGIGFAIPVRRIEDVLASWLVPDFFSNGTVGLVPLNQRDAEGNWRIVAMQVVPGGPAAVAGLSEETVIVAVNGEAVSRSFQVGQRLWLMRPGDVLRLTDDENEQYEIVIGEMGNEQLIGQRLGLQVQELSSSLKAALQIPEKINGLVVSDVLEDGPGALQEIRRGDIIVGIGQLTIVEKEELGRRLRQVAPGQAVELHVLSMRLVRDQQFLQQRSLPFMLQ